MRTFTNIVLIAIALTGCGNAAHDEKAGPMETDTALPATDVSADSVSVARTAPVEDQLITCIEDRGNSITTTERFLIIDGAIKRYSEFENLAFDLCEPGQEGCALGWQDEKITMLYTAPNGTRSIMKLDVDALMIERQTDGGETEPGSYSGTCTSGSLPDGLQVM